MTRLTDFCPVAALALLLALCGCGEGDLEVSGNVDRVIGETITLELTKGDDPFSGEVTLVGADGRSYPTADLSVSKKSDTLLSFVVPPGVAPGPARAKVARTAEAPAYAVPLNISRLALTLDDKGTLELLPLAPSTLRPTTRSVGQSGGVLRLSPSGGVLGVLSANQLGLLALGKSPRDLTAGLSMTGGTCLAALSDGVLVGDQSEVKLLRLIQGKGITQQGSFAVSACQDIAVDNRGQVALVLHRCSVSGGPTSDCVTELSLGSGSGSGQVGRSAVLDGTPGAVAVRLTGAGDGAVVADADGLYGISLGGGNSSALSVSKLQWGFAATPVSLARTAGRVRVSAGLTTLFAVAETGRNSVLFAGFDGGALKWVYAGSDRLKVQLTVAPIAVSFGRLLELFVAAGPDLLKVQNLQVSTEARSTGVAPSSRPVAFAVQP